MPRGVIDWPRVLPLAILVNCIPRRAAHAPTALVRGAHLRSGMAAAATGRPLSMGGHIRAKYPELEPSGKPMYSVDPSSGIDLADWARVIDVRSPGEYAEDHVPGAVSLPVLEDEERAEVGTLHAKESPFQARLRGAALVALNLHRILQSDHVTSLEPDAPILVYCWRGGERSKSLAHVLSRVGFDVGLVRGGYKAYRAHVREQLAGLGDYRYHVIGGSTGSAKGKLLDMLLARGAQVVDLEGLANHKGSILGANPESPQPSQKAFESALVHQFRAFDKGRPIFVESESNLVGKIHVPKAMFARMQGAPRTMLKLPMPARVAWIRACYRYFETTHTAKLKAAIVGLTRLQGHRQVAEWTAAIDEERWDDLVESLLVNHYDPAYARSAELHYDKGALGAATALQLEDTSDDTYARAADMLVGMWDAPAEEGDAPDDAEAGAQVSTEASR